MVIKKRGRPKNIKAPLDKSGSPFVKSSSPYGKIYKVVSSESQKIKPTMFNARKLEDTFHERISKVTIRGQNRIFRNKGRKK